MPLGGETLKPEHLKRVPELKKKMDALSDLVWEFEGNYMMYSNPVKTIKSNDRGDIDSILKQNENIRKIVSEFKLKHDQIGVKFQEDGGFYAISIPDLLYGLAEYSKRFM